MRQNVALPSAVATKQAAGADPPNADVWYPENDFAAHYAANRDADGTYLYPATDTTHCDPTAAGHDCGYGADLDGQRYYFVAYYLYYVGQELIRLDLGDALNGRSLMWSGSLSYVFRGPEAGAPAARRVAVALDAYADHFGDYVHFYPVHLEREPGLAAFLSGYDGVFFGRMKDGVALLNMIRGYDITFDIWSDGEVLSALERLHPERATGATPAHIEEDLFWPAAEKVKASTIWGNASLPHDLLLHMAFVLDAGARSQELIDWVFGEGRGRLPELFFHSIDRDGGCDEVAPNYCAVGYPVNLDTGSTLALFRNGAFALAHEYSLPFPGLESFHQRLSSFFGWARQLETIPGYYVHLGDDGPTDGPGMPPLPSLFELSLAFDRFGHDPRLAAQALERNGGTLDGLHTSVWCEDPFAVQAKMAAALEHAGGAPALEPNLAGYGFAQLRDLNAARKSSVWTYFGRSNKPGGSFGGHAHHDQLDFGMQYNGRDFMPVPGYPSGFGWRYFGWEANTVIHNTMIVDRAMQSRRLWASDIKTFLDTPGSPVSVIEVESKTAYPGAYEHPVQLAQATLSRTLMKIPLGDGAFFVVELSTIRGGNVHHYSYHGGGPTATPKGLNPNRTAATYAAADSGLDVSYEEPYDFTSIDAGCRASRSCVEQNAYLYRGSGFQFLADAAYATRVPAGFSLTWNQNDWPSTNLTNDSLTAWMFPLTAFDQAALATGRMPMGQPVRYLLLRAENGPAGSAIVNVWQPELGGDGLIKDVSLIAQAVSETGAMVALDVTLHDGRIYHVAIDQDGTQPRQAGKLAWRGRFAVYAERLAGQASKNAKGGQGKPAPTFAKLYAYLGEGTELSYAGLPQIANQVASLTGAVANVYAAGEENRIIAAEPLAPDDLIDRWIDIEPAEAQVYWAYRDATFRIRSITTQDDLFGVELGATSLLGAYQDTANYAAGFSLLANPGDRYRIALDGWN